MPQRAVADQPGAQQRRRLQVGDTPSGSGKQKRSSATAQLGVAAVELVAGEAGAVAEVLAARSCSSGTRRRSSRATARRRGRRPRSARRRPSTRADDLVPGHERQLRLGSSPSTTCRSVRQTPQACTRAAPGPAPGSRLGQLGGPQRRAGRVEHHRAHHSRKASEPPPQGPLRVGRQVLRPELDHVPVGVVHESAHGPAEADRPLALTTPSRAAAPPAVQSPPRQVEGEVHVRAAAAAGDADLCGAHSAQPGGVTRRGTSALPVWARPRASPRSRERRDRSAARASRSWTSSTSSEIPVTGGGSGTGGA